VAFAVVPFLALGILRLLHVSEAWQKQAVLYVVAMAIPLLLVVARRKKPPEYGIDFRHPRYHLNIMLTCFFPVALSAMAYLVADEIYHQIAKSNLRRPLLFSLPHSP